MADIKIFIDTETLNGYTDISENIDPQYIMKNIPLAQDINIRECLGDDLYEEIYTQFSSNTLSAANKALMPMIKMALAWYAYKRYAVRCTFQSTPVGFRKKTSDQSESLTPQELSIIIKDNQETAEHYAGRLAKYLDDNHTSYPLWKSGCETSNHTSAGVF